MPDLAFELIGIKDFDWEIVLFQSKIDTIVPPNKKSKGTSPNSVLFKLENLIWEQGMRIKKLKVTKYKKNSKIFCTGDKCSRYYSELSELKLNF